MSDVRVASSSSLFRWDVKHVLAPDWHRPSTELVPFGKIARRRMQPNDGMRPYGSVHFDGEITIRPAATALRGQTFVAHPQDVVFSRIDVRHGAIGVVPEEFGELAFSNEYPIYDVETPGALLPDFVRILCRTKTFQAQVEALVVGHSGRKRVSAEMFEMLQIPAPGNSEQQQIIKRYRDEIAQSGRLRSQAEAVKQEAIANITHELSLRSPDVLPIQGPFVASSQDLRQWSVFAATAAVRGIDDGLTSRYPVRPLGDPDLSKVTYGIQKSPKNRPGDNSRPYLRVANVQDSYLDLCNIKYIDVPPRQVASFRLEAGDLLLCEGNSKELVGRPAIWNNEIEECVHQNHVLRVRLNRAELIPEYVLAYMQSAPSRGHFRRRAKNTTNLATINSADVRELSIPVPPMQVQERIAEIWMGAIRVSRDLANQAEAAVRKAAAQAELDVSDGISV